MIERVDRQTAPDLSDREQDVLDQIMRAATSKEAGRALGISQRTVEIHRAKIMKKMGARNVVHLVLMVCGRAA
jgi:two-component system response regulator FixJ